MGNFKQNAYLRLKARRQAAEFAAYERRNSLLSDDEYSKLSAECTRLGFEIARLGACKQDTSDLKATLSDKKRLRDERLADLGYTPEDLEPHYHCSICNDTGITPDGRECACLKELIYDALREGAPGIPTDVYDFGSLTEKLPEDIKINYGKVYTMLNRFADEFPAVHTKIFGLLGPVGCGKSYAAGVLANAVMRKGYSVLYLNATQLGNLFLRYHTAQLAEKEGIFSPLLDADLLVIDDLGAEPTYQNVTVNYLYALLSLREDKPIVFTSNLPFEQLRDRYGDRILSRLSDKTRAHCFMLGGRDLRVTRR